jgi:hypothetical protein
MSADRCEHGITPRAECTECETALDDGVDWPRWLP